MLTKQDKEFLKENFATKNDVKTIVDDALVPVKKDLDRVETTLDSVNQNVRLLDTKVSSLDIRVSHLEKAVDKTKQAVDELTEFVVPAIGNILEWTDDIHRAIVGRPSKQSHGN